MAFRDAFDATDPSVIEQLYASPAKTGKAIARGAVRGAAALPGDLIDLAAKVNPLNVMGDPELGPLTRALLDKVPALKATGERAEGMGEALAPNPLGPAAKGVGMAGSIMVGANRAVKGGLLHPQALIDALKAFKTGRPMEETWAKTGVHVSNPRILQDTPLALTPIETPGYGMKGPAGIYPEVDSFGNMVRKGDVTGMDEFLRLYPELSGTMVKRYTNAGDKNFGGFSPSRNEISVNYGHAGTHPGEAELTLPHELGHGQQHADKMPNGGNPSMGDEVVQRIGGVLGKNTQRLESAAILRALLDDMGASQRPVAGHASVRDALQLWNANKAATKGHQLDDKALAFALKNPLNVIDERLALAGRFNERVPSNAADAYFRTWGEAMARRNEGMAGKSVADVRKAHNPKVFDRLLGLDDAKLFDLGEFNLRTLDKAGLRL